jgi:hypothetical protein
MTRLTLTCDRPKIPPILKTVPPPPLPPLISDYKSVDEAKTAIDRYFAERNAHFRDHPRRAGKKLWGKEREPAVFSEASNLGFLYAKVRNAT